MNIYELNSPKKITTANTVASTTTIAATSHYFSTILSITIKSEMIDVFDVEGLLATILTFFDNFTSFITI